MTMSRQHYKLIASILKKNVTDAKDPTSRVSAATPQALTVAMALQFADVLKQTNDRFDRERFLEACGVDHESISKNQVVIPGVAV